MQDLTQQLSWISSERELRRHIAKPSRKVLQKVQTHVDVATENWLAKATLAGVAISQPDRTLDIRLHAHPKELLRVEKGYVVIQSPTLFGGETTMGDQQPVPAGMLVMLPGLDSTLRINGRLEYDRQEERVCLEVHENFYHCPKAFLRSGLWRGRVEHTPFSALEQEGLGEQSREFIKQSPFALLATCSSEGQVDLSPRGDPAGFVKIPGENTLFLPERTGNRIADSLRNILSYPRVSLMMLIPGSSWGLHIQGEAGITNDPGLLELSAIRGKRPRVGIVMEVQKTSIQPISALKEVEFWKPENYIQSSSLLSPGELLVRQLEPEGHFSGVKGKIVDWILELDAKKNLY